MAEQSTQEAAKPILVIGGTGKTGRRVAQRLKARDVPVRIGSRSGEPAFDWQDQTTWQPVLQGVGAVYITYYPDLGFPGAAEAIGAFAKQAVRSGAGRLVLLSGRGEEQAQVSEQALKDATDDWTIVRASWFNQNFSENFLLEPVLSGEIALPAGDAVEPFVDAEDIADVAVAALTEEGHAGHLYELSGPRLLTFADTAAEISAALGRQVRYVAITAEQYIDVLAENGVPTEFVELFTTTLDGRNAHLTDGVQRALGREPRDFRDYARETAATGVWNV
ncbi:NmrA family NAD(P)-binding protein [Salinactinospora qingdaonensis]|uniref:NAD(P)H-binding protein n=1 Tax=Salinactinospora qingdaonensis TaxID=702744 RepID=A0ABP7EV10_9ACTN